MQERKLFVEIPGGKNSFHSAVLTSFSFDFHHFEYQALKSLRKKWILNVAVLVDHNKLNGVLGLASGNLKQLSQSYSINGVKANGAFHPKINFMIGDSKLLMFFGSGNITPSGHGKNHEIFTGFYADSNESKQLPLLNEAWNYIQNLSKDLSGYSKERIFKIIPPNCELLKKHSYENHLFHKLDSNIEVALLYNEKTSIFNQLISLVPKNKIIKITIVCPYYDEDGELLNLLQNHFSKSELEVYLPKDFGLPPNKIKTNKAINFFEWEKTERGQTMISGKNNYERKLHSKIFHFQSDDKDLEYCLIGSANATIFGFGSSNKKAINEEFGALYKTRKVKFLNLLGIKGVKSKVKVSNYTREAALIGKASEYSKSKSKLFIASADMEGLKIFTYYKSNEKFDKSHISIFNDYGELIYSEPISDSSENILTLNITKQVKEQNPVFVEITDHEGKGISNKQLINNLDKLYSTDPSKSNRSINKILNSIKLGNKDELEILEYINNLSRTKEVPNDNVKKQFGNKSTKKEQDVFSMEMTYDEAIIASKNKHQYDKIINSHSTIRIWELVSELFNDINEEVDDELMDEEEEGSAETGRERKDSQKEDSSEKMTDKKSQARIVSKLKIFVENYIKSINKVCSLDNHEIDVIDLSQFLLVTYVLTSIAYFPKYEVSTESKGDNLRDILKPNFYELMLQVLIGFSKLIIKHKIKKFGDNNYQKDKLERYINRTIFNSSIYIYLLNKNNSAPSVAQLTEIISLNLFRFLGKIDNEYDVYIDNFFKSNNELHFNSSGILQLMSNHLSTFDKLKDENKYFFIGHSGHCLNLEENGNQIKYRSVFGVNSIPKSKIKAIANLG